MEMRHALLRWFDSGSADADDQASGASGASGASRIDWLRVLPFVVLHVACIGAWWTGVSATAVVTAVALYAIRMFGITAFYHRYCSHRAFVTSRATQFVLALIAGAAAQRGPLWWASHHRHHHANSDQPQDVHSARQHGFLWSHIGWFLASGNFSARSGLVPDLARFAELRWLDRFDVAAPLALIAMLYVTGEALAVNFPGLQTNGAQLVVWGFCISTIVLYHATFTINSLAHRFGTRRYATHDDSRNNPWLALLTFGEGWHNNHHHFPGSASQGFFWWEIDITYWGLRFLQRLRLVWNLREVPTAMLCVRLEPEGI